MPMLIDSVSVMAVEPIITPRTVKNVLIFRFIRLRRDIVKTSRLLIKLHILPASSPYDYRYDDAGDDDNAGPDAYPDDR